MWHANKCIVVLHEVLRVSRRNWFQVQSHDACVANCAMKNKQHTVQFHVDDLMSSHVNSAVDDEFLD